MKTFRKLYLLDYLSPQPCLYIKTLTRYSTLMGLIFSLLITFAFVAMAFYFMIHFFFGQEMTVIYSKETTFEDFALNLTNRLFAFQFYNYSNSNTVDARIATAAGYLWTYRGNETIIQPLQLERCELDKHFPKSQYAFVFDNINIDRFTCVNTNDNITNLSLYANQSDVSGTYIMIFLATCANSTENNNTCLPQSVIERAMESNRYYFTALLENVNINHYNSTSPLSFAPFFNSYTMSYTLRTDMSFNWQPIEYTEDNGWLFVSERTYKNYIMEETLNKVSFSANNTKYYHPNAFVKIQFSIYHQSKDKYKRTYPKIQSVIANMSGIVTVTTQVTQMVLSLFTLGQYYWFVFDFADTLQTMTGISNCANFSFNALKRGSRFKEENSYVKELNDVFELRSKKTMFNNNNNNNNNCANKGNLCDMSTIRIHSSVSKIERNKVNDNDNDITYCVAFKWMCFPKSRKLNRQITKFERKLKSILSVENIVKEIIRGKNNERMITLLENNNGNNIGSNINNGNYIINNTNMKQLHNNNNNNKHLNYMYEPKCTIHSKHTSQSNKVMLNDKEDKSEIDSTTQIKMRPVNLNVKFINKANFNVDKPITTNDNPQEQGS